MGKPGILVEPAEAMDVLRAVLDGTGELAIVGEDLDGRIVLWNAGARCLYGHGAEDVVGTRSADVLATEDDRAAGLPAQARRAALRNGRWEGTLTRVRGDGSPFSTDVVLAAWHDRHGRPVGVLEIARDVSADTRLVEEEQFRGLLETAPDAMVIVDAGGRIVLVNRQTEELFGYRREELLGRPIEALVPQRFHDRHVGHRDGYLARPGVRPMGAGLELYGRRKDDSEFPVEISLSPLETDQGTLVSAAVRDITGRKQAEEALHQATQAAEQANQAKSEYLSRMSHELRTPLNAILGFAQVLELDELDQDQRDSLAHIRAGGEHLLSLINEVLDIAAIEAGKLPLSLEPVAVAEMLAEAVTLIRPLADQQGVMLIVQPDLPTQHVLGDRQRLKQVLLNLLSNGVKYNREGGSVQVACEAVGIDRLQIKVTDTGIGIPPESLERLFVPFERLGTEQSGIEGTGLGLPLSERLAQAMGGTLGVTSTAGQGSTFWVELPLAESPLERLERRAEPLRDEPAWDRGLTTVLYIEDNLSNLQLVEHVMGRQPNVKLISAMRPQLGLDLAAEHHPDLILLDLDLPDIPGEEVLRRLRAEPRTADVPVVILSADARPGLISHLLEEGARAFLTKPLDIKELLAVLDTVRT